MKPEYPVGYLVYRDMVLAKCPPAHIHTINGKLGIVLNCKVNMKWWIEHNFFAEATACRASLQKAENEIKEITGVSFPS